MVLLKLLGIEINLQTIISFLLGILVGFILLLLIYVYAAIKGLNRNLIINKVVEEDIDEEEIKALIKGSMNNFKDKKLREEVGYGNHLVNEIKELTILIAEKFYPNKPYPYLELTIDETIELNHYLTDRVSELLEPKIFRLIKGMKLSDFAAMVNTKNKIEESRVVKAVKKSRLDKVLSGTLKVINYANPVMWIRKGMIEPINSWITVKIGSEIIGVAGEEIYKVYSKKALEEERNIKVTSDDLYEEIRRDLKEGDIDEWETPKN